MKLNNKPITNNVKTDFIDINLNNETKKKKNIKIYNKIKKIFKKNSLNVDKLYMG
jgi:hypothetical protein